MRYKYILIGLLLIFLSSVVHAQSLHIDGKLYFNGSVDLGRISISDLPQTTPLGSGTHRYVFLLKDDYDRTLSKNVISSYTLHYDSFSNGTGGNIEPDSFDFLVRLPISNRTQVLMIEQENTGKLLYYIDLKEISCNSICEGCADYYGIVCDPPREPMQRGDPLIPLLLSMIIFLVIVLGFILVMKRRNVS